MLHVCCNLATGANAWLPKKLKGTSKGLRLPKWLLEAALQLKTDRYIYKMTQCLNLVWFGNRRWGIGLPVLRHAVLLPAVLLRAIQGYILYVQEVVTLQTKYSNIFTSAN